MGDVRPRGTNPKAIASSPVTCLRAARVAALGHLTRPAFQHLTEEPSNFPRRPVSRSKAVFTASARELELYPFSCIHAASRSFRVVSIPPHRSLTITHRQVTGQSKSPR
ncbi:hypothetical protein GCM10010512_00070 [Streptomyces thermoviolaceus subsp. thermoviolaceus]|nr:hypothetical protein GCM10010499_35150 [Streptomyces thermoviolaceus subsp. apingens]GHA73988.1 hypothetical protein GCM10010512_00070 [Streptomyces thermoviolaceus subsp. thermoviolaceus]